MSASNKLFCWYAWRSSEYLTDLGLFRSFILLFTLYILKPTSSKKLFAGLFGTFFLTLSAVPAFPADSILAGGNGHLGGDCCVYFLGLCLFVNLNSNSCGLNSSLVATTRFVRRDVLEFLKVDSAVFKSPNAVF